MLTAAATLAVLLAPAAVLVAVLLGVEALQRRRQYVITRQIMLTDAIHAELGAVVAPVVQKRAFRPWKVSFALPGGHARDVEAMIAITDRVLGAELRSPDDLRIVLTPLVPVGHTRAA